MAGKDDSLHKLGKLIEGIDIAMLIAVTHDPAVLPENERMNFGSRQ